ncbi:MAG: hypothetical protein ACPK7O_02475 [Methanobacterium sp.]
MRKITFPIIILIIVATISGCTYKDNDPSEDKTYNDSEISFSYPPEYEIKEINDRNGLIVEGTSGWDGNCTFKIYKEDINKKTNSLEDLKNKGFTLEENEIIPIDGANASDMIYAHYAPPYVKYEKITFQKNNKQYTLLFEYKGVGVTDTRATTLISKTFKVLNNSY